MLNDMVYGGTAQNMVASRTRVRIPLWSNEGLAEFLSSNWDTKADMVLRDIAVHERMPTINELNYFMAYKGGQSLWRFIAGKYGREKVGEVFRSMKKTQSAEKGYERALGMKWKELSDQWHKYLKKECFGLCIGFAKLKISKIKKYIFRSYLIQTFYVL